MSTEACAGRLEKVVSRKRIEAGPPTMWRYRDLLPIEQEVPVGEHCGMTPLIRARRLEKALGAQEVYIKNDAVCHPSLSFKDAAGAGDWLSASLIDSLAGKGSDRLRLADRSFLLSALCEGQRLSTRNCSFPGARGAMYEAITIQTGTVYCPHC